MFEELPDTKKLYELCEGIYIAQQEGDLVREKQLYDLLIMLYRSPEALMKITGSDTSYKEDESDTVPGLFSDFDNRTVSNSGSSGSTSRRSRRGGGDGPDGGNNEGGSRSDGGHAKQD